MNRREAIAALMALPATARITRAAVEANDVIVVECDRPLSASTAEFIRTKLQEIWPEQKCVVLDAALNLKIVDGKDA